MVNLLTHFVQNTIKLQFRIIQKLYKKESKKQQLTKQSSECSNVGLSDWQRIWDLETKINKCFVSSAYIILYE